MFHSLSSRAAVLALALCIVGCRSYRLVQPITCESVLRLELGQREDLVRKLIGEPVSTFAPWWNLADGTKPEAAASYGPTETPDGNFDIWDEMYVYYINKRLVAVSAIQMRGGHSGHTVAFRLNRKFKSSDAESKREIGPAFESMFRCSQGFTRPLKEPPSAE
jgi:hypothetical protein